MSRQREQDPIVERFHEVIAVLDPSAQLQTLLPLEGGAFSHMWLLELTDANQIEGVRNDDAHIESSLPSGLPKTIILRIHGETGRKWSRSITRNEFELLQSLFRLGLPVPEPLYLDISRSIIPEPYMLLRYIDGRPGVPQSVQHTSASEPGFDDSRKESSVDWYLNALAQVMWQIHSVDRSSLPADSLPGQSIDPAITLPDHPAVERTLRRHIIDFLQISAGADQVLLHGDLWPGNVVVRDRTIAGVIDWTDCRLGNRLIDLSNSRIELLLTLLLDENRTENYDLLEKQIWQFTRAYVELASSASVTIDRSILLFYDLAILLSKMSQFERWKLAPDVMQEFIKRSEWYLMRLIERIEG